MIRWDYQAAAFGFPATDEGIHKMLHQWYVDLKMSAIQIGARVGTTTPTVLRALRKYGIEPRSKGGAQNVVWKRQEGARYGKG